MIEKRESWTFLSNHAHVLVCIAQDENARLRDIAVEVGITERVVQKIVTELVGAGVLDKLKEGRRNRYFVNAEARLRHRLENHATVGELLELLARRKVAHTESLASADRVAGRQR